MNKPQAFPDQLQAGMSLRDYFAAAVMQGLVAEGGVESWRAAAAQAYEAADFMLEHREEAAK